MTEEQTAIFGAGRTLVDGKPLTPRQQAAWDLVRTSPYGVSVDEVGAAWHAARGKHAADKRCEWDSKDGLNVLRSAALLTLVTRKKATSRFYCRNAADALVDQAVPEPTREEDAERRYPPLVEEIPF